MTDRDEEVRVWLVERTYSDDEQNLIILVYATEDGEKYMRKERALTSFEDARDTKAGLDVDAERLAEVRDDETKEKYAKEARKMAEKHEADDAVRGLPDRLNVGTQVRLVLVAHDSAFVRLSHHLGDAHARDLGGTTYADFALPVPAERDTDGFFLDKWLSTRIRSNAAYKNSDQKKDEKEKKPSSTYFQLTLLRTRVRDPP